jgi:hypothetical protein
LKRLIDFIVIVAVVAITHAFFDFIQFEYLTAFNNTIYMSVLFIPAAVRVFSVMLFGYWAGFGIALGVFLHDYYIHPVQNTQLEMFVSVLQQGAGASFSLLIWAMISKKVSGITNPNINFADIDAFDVLQMCLIQAIVNSTTAHAYYIWSSTINHHFDIYYYAVMLVGDLTGAFLFFIMANLIFSLLLRTGFISRKYYEDTGKSEFVWLKR